MDLQNSIKIETLLFHLSWLSSLYFALLALNHYVIKSRFVLFGVFQELVTLPIMFAQFIICIAAFYFWMKNAFKFKEYSFVAFVISLSNCLVVAITFLSR
jgi:hypothetical protein